MLSACPGANHGTAAERAAVDAIGDDQPAAQLVPAHDGGQGEGHQPARDASGRAEEAAPQRRQTGRSQSSQN